MERRIIQVKEYDCTGCGDCVSACPYADIGLMNGKAYLLNQAYCNGLGECIPACPHDAIYFSIEEVEPFNLAAAERHAQQVRHPGRAAHAPAPRRHAASAAAPPSDTALKKTWPVQLSLIPKDAAFLDNADILLAASCAPFVRDSFQHDFMEGRVVLVACPRLDKEDYRRAFEDILKDHNVQSVTVVRMADPSCSGLEEALSRAVERTGKSVPSEVIVLSNEGGIRLDSRN